MLLHSHKGHIQSQDVASQRPAINSLRGPKASLHQGTDANGCF